MFDQSVLNMYVVFLENIIVKTNVKVLQECENAEVLTLSRFAKNVKTRECS